MKKNYLLFAFLLLVALAYSQDDKNKKVVLVGDLFEVTIYYDNGTIMQHGFMTKDNKLHASWESYNPDGTKKCNAIYDKGVKIGTWYYWIGDKIKKVTYEKNRIIKVEEVESID